MNLAFNGNWTRASIKGRSLIWRMTQIFKFLSKCGVPYGSRTRVAAVKGRCPRPREEREARRNVYRRAPSLSQQRSACTQSDLAHHSVTIDPIVVDAAEDHIRDPPIKNINRMRFVDSLIN